MAPETLLDLWLRQARASERVHYRLGSRLAAADATLTACAVVASTVVGSSLFVLLDKTASYDLKLGLAIASAAAAILVAVQRNLGLSALAEQHRAAGANWQRAVSKVAVALVYTNDEQRLRTAVDDLEKVIDDIVAKSPQIPQHWFKKAKLDAIYQELEQYAAAAVGGASD